MAAKPYREGQTWSFRLRLKGQDIYRTGFVTEGAARRETERLQQKLREAGKPKHDGPWQTTVAKAIQLYALERLPAMKGARQEAGRINAVLRAAGLDVVKVTPLESAAAGAEENKESGLYWTVALVPESGARKIPKGLGVHRQNQRDRKACSERLRQVLAKCPVAQVMSYHVQELMDAMQGDGAKPATIALERALLRRLFNYARQMWGWVEPARNPARDLVLPPVNNGRTRILTNAEWRRICTALEHARNDYVAPALALLLETSMRVSEPLLQARWPDIDWETCILHLRDAKAGPRDVPLSPPAMAADAEDDVMEKRYIECRQQVREAKAQLERLEAGQVKLDVRAVEAQIQVDPSGVVDGLFSSEMAPERVRTTLARLLPSIIFLGKQGRYTSFFRVEFAAGAALSMASGTDTVEIGAAIQHFRLRYTPNNRGNGGQRWSVAVVTDEELPQRPDRSVFQPSAATVAAATVSCPA